MSDFALTAAGSLEITSGKLRVATGMEALAQRIRTRLRLFRGDWFLNLLEGVPYHDYVLRKSSTAAMQREVIRRALVTMRGVREVVSLTVELDARTRTLTVVGEVRALDMTGVPFVENLPLFGMPALPAEGAAS